MEITDLICIFDQSVIDRRTHKIENSQYLNNEVRLKFPLWLILISNESKLSGLH